jgi:hypothetical protein
VLLPGAGGAGNGVCRPEDLYQRAWGVVEIDFCSYFTSIPHDKLLKLIRQRVVDGSMLGNFQ